MKRERLEEEIGKHLEVINELVRGYCEEINYKPDELTVSLSGFPYERDGYTKNGFSLIRTDDEDEKGQLFLFNFHYNKNGIVHDGTRFVEDEKK